LPDHDPDEHWDLEDIRKAGEYVLNGTNPLVIPGSAMLTKPAGSDTPGPSTSENGSSQGIKQEDLSNMFGKFAQKIISTMTNKNTTPEVASAIRNFLCNFCGMEGHFLGNCKIVEEYIQEGKCRKNSEGRIVLPTGAFLPKAIIGRFMKERFNEWHRHNPGQVAVGILSVNTTEGLMYNCIPSQYNYQSMESDKNRESHEDYLKREAMINLLIREAQLLACGKPIFDGVEIVRPKVTKGTDKEISNQVSKELPKVAGPSKAKVWEETQQEEVPTVHKLPVHPFANIPEAQYAPPAVRNFGIPLDKVSKEKEKAYKTLAPVTENSVVDQVFDRMMKKTMVVMTWEEVLNLSPEMHEKFRQAVTPRRVPIKEMEQAKKVEMNLNLADKLPYLEEGEIEEDLEEKEIEIPKSGILEISSEESEESEEEDEKVEVAYVVPHHYEALIQTIGNEEKSDDL
jgi:hypothetical protein